jgi:hypothetical protein
MVVASGCYRALHDLKTALPDGKALKELCVVQRGLKDFVAAGGAGHHGGTGPATPGAVQVYVVNAGRIGP